MSEIPLHAAEESEQPRFGIVIAAFNAAASLPGALESVLEQEDHNWEAVVVDDGSTDDTLSIAQRYAARDPRIAVISQANAGTGAARNAGLAELDAAFVMYLDADDRLAPHHMTAMRDLMSRYPGRDIYSSDGLCTFQDGSSSMVFGYGRIVELRIEDLIRECRILGGGALVRSDALRDLGGYRAEFYAEDYDLWLRALASGLSHVATPEVLYIYDRSVEGQKSKNPTAGYGSAVRALEDLIDSGLLNEAQVSKARASIERYRVGPQLEEQSLRLRSRLNSVLGERTAGKLMRLSGSVSWAVRPLRRWLARRGH